MGDPKRLVAFVLAIVGIVASLLLPWWQIGVSGVSLEISLRDAEVCFMGTCQAMKTSGAYGIVAVITFAYGWIAVLGIVFGGLLPTLSGERTKPSAPVAGLLYLMLAGLTYGTLDIPPEVERVLDVEMAWAFWAGIAGATIALFSPLLGPRERSLGDGRPVLYKAPQVVADPGLPARPHATASAEAVTSSSPRPRPASTSPVVESATAPRPASASTAPPIITPSGRAPMAPIDLDAPPEDPDAPFLAPANEFVPPTPRVGSEADARVVDVPLLPPRPARVTASPSGGVRFAIARAELREDALVVQDEEGHERVVPWTELGGALARELTGPPFAADALLVDLVPRRGAPLRFVATTSLVFAAAAAGGASPRDDLRRVLAFARAMHPGLEIEEATADFLYKRDPLPAWSADDLDRYDARYRAG